MNYPKTCVIGAGISGLTAGKILGDYGVPYDCFELSDRVGGNWAFRNPNGKSSAYRSLHIDTSKHKLSFRDFPIPDEFPDFPHHTQIKEYLDSYAEAFGLLDRIQFQNGVEKAVSREGGGWQVTTQDGEAREYDVLVVGNGHHWDPRYPDFPGTFDGKTIHSHHYIDPTEPLDLRDQRILVVGIGNSAADIASELSQKSYGNKVFLSTRSGAWVIPKYLFGRPVDEVVSTFPQVSLKFQRRMARWSPKLISGSPERYGLPTPNHNFLEAHPTISSELLLRIGSGDITAKPNVRELEGDRVNFEDGSSEPIDVIIYATGYNITFPFFDEEFLSAPGNVLGLYKRMLHPDIDDLVFVGFAQALPTLFPFVENQCRLLGNYLTGRYRPPSPDEMRAVITEDQQKYGGHYVDRPRHTQQVDYYVYVYEMDRKELPEGARRAAERGPVQLAGRTA